MKTGFMKNHSMNTADDDSGCMARLVAGDSQAVQELYQRHGHALLRFSSAMCRSRQAAEDMVHDTFVALMRIAVSTAVRPGRRLATRRPPGT